MAESSEAGLQPIEPSPAKKTNLDLVNECDNFPYPDTDPEGYTSHISTYYHLFIPPCPTVLGYMLPSVALTLKGIPGWTLNEKERTLTLDLPTLPPSTSTNSANADTSSTTPDTTTRTSASDVPALSDSAEVPPPPSSNNEPTPSDYEVARTATLAATTAAMRATSHFAVLHKWRNELYPIYWRDPENPSEKTLLASIERAASPLFGVVTYGVHMTAYTRTPPNQSKNDAGKHDAGIGEGMWLYVPRRAPTKQTYPSLLDQTVAGGISTGESAFESLVRESEEEACLPAELVRRKAKAVGVVSYFHVRDERAGGETRLLQPECQFCYDLDLTGERRSAYSEEKEGGDDGGNEITPKSGDEEEVGAFELLSVAEVQAALARGEFKPNCALVVLDFLVRHGVLTRENEVDYVEICQRLRRRLEFPVL